MTLLFLSEIESLPTKAQLIAKFTETYNYLETLLKTYKFGNYLSGKEL